MNFLDYSIISGILALAVGVIIMLIMASVVLYVYSSLALQTIGKKLKYKHPWLAWIPLANISMIFEMGGFHWALVFLLLVPFAGWVAIVALGVISLWRIYEKRRYPGALALIYVATIIPVLNFASLIANLVVLGLVAWKDN